MAQEPLPPRSGEGEDVRDGHLADLLPPAAISPEDLDGPALGPLPSEESAPASIDALVSPKEPALLTLANERQDVTESFTKNTVAADGSAGAPGAPEVEEAAEFWFASPAATPAVSEVDGAPSEDVVETAEAGEASDLLDIELPSLEMLFHELDVAGVSESETPEGGDAQPSVLLAASFPAATADEQTPDSSLYIVQGESWPLPEWAALSERAAHETTPASAADDEQSRASTADEVVPVAVIEPAGLVAWHSVAGEQEDAEAGDVARAGVELPNWLETPSLVYLPEVTSGRSIEPVVDPADPAGADLLTPSLALPEETLAGLEMDVPELPGFAEADVEALELELPTLPTFGEADEEADFTIDLPELPNFSDFAVAEAYVESAEDLTVEVPVLPDFFEPQAAGSVDDLDRLLAAVGLPEQRWADSQPADLWAPARGQDEDPDDSAELQQQLDEIIARIDDEVTGVPVEPVEVADQSAARQPARTDDYVVFTLAGTQYALPLAQVTEMDKAPRVTAIPHSPDFVLGVTNLRGDIVALLDLRLLLGLPHSDDPRLGRMIVVRVEAGDQWTVAGLLVDSVVGIAPVAGNTLQKPVGPDEDRAAAFLRGVCEHREQLLNVLDLDLLFRSAEMQQFQEA